MLILTLLALLASILPARIREDAQASEAELKAAWTFNFLQHVEWPASAFKDERSPLVLCVLGASGAEEPLAKALRGKSAQGRPVELRRAAKPEDVRGAHAVFVSDAEKGRLEEVAAAARGTSLLLIAESEGQARRGAALNFFVEDSRVRFEANVASAGRSGVTLSTKLLKFARLVKD